jgi:hypothetical protein
MKTVKWICKMALPVLLLSISVAQDQQEDYVEESLLTEVVTLAKKKVLKDFEAQSAANSQARRDAHPKAHGCVSAKFQVASQLPEQYKVGLFKNEGKVYSAIVRLSNGAGVKPDSEPDTRGMAIKLLNVDGKKSKIEENGDELPYQDFLMVSHPVFIARNLTDYRDFFQDVVLKGSLMKYFFPSLNPYYWRVKELQIARTIKGQKHSNLLDLSYFSMTPYQFGKNEVMKFAVKPCDNNRPSTAFPENPSENFLKDQLVKDLSQQAACFDFSVQLSEHRLPIDDATVEWDSAFQKVARLTISSQTFDTQDQQDDCEQMSFDPWNALNEHRPRGSLNVGRKDVYREVSRYRHELNHRDIFYPQE